MIRATINGTAVELPQETFILDAARKVGVAIPVLCKHPDLCATGACGLCIVRVSGAPRLLRACCTPVVDGMEITTHDPEIVAVRRTVVELILSRHPNECLTCGRSGLCELQQIAADFGIRNGSLPNLTPTAEEMPVDCSTGVIDLDPRKCIACGRCIEVCQNIQDVHALCFNHRGIRTRIAAAGISLAESPCVSCGQCSAHCPTGAIVEHDETPQVWSLLQDERLHTVVQIAPAVRVAIGEAFGYPPGVNLTGQLYAALRRMGFDRVFDTNFGADLTILEEGHEFVHRFTNGGVLPMITSCCPAWVDFLEKYHSDLIPHVSTAKSPQAMIGALSKTYYAQRGGIDPANMRVVSIMPCTAKKWEIRRSAEMSSSGFQDVDVSLTTRELARMIKQAGIDFAALQPEECDPLLGVYTGAATIFGATGGVMEAALRTAAEVISGESLPSLDIHGTRGLAGIKEATIEIAGNAVRIAVVHGLANVAKVMDAIRRAAEAGEDPPWHFIEVMACPGGCVGGGGQPYGVTDSLRKARAGGLYSEDAAMAVRKSHENPAVQVLYKDYLGSPLSERCHQLLHTEYTPRPIYQR